MFVDDELRLEETAAPAGAEFGTEFLAPPAVTTPISVDAGTPVALRIEFDLHSRPVIEGLEALFSLVVGLELNASDPGGLLDEAVRTAAGADVAIIVVGTNSQVESEGFDRTGLALPGRQDELVAAIAATGTPTIAVVNAGAPVLLPWRDQVSALLVTYFGGQEMGNALADVLLGTAEPGGRLPTTWPKSDSDIPVLDVTPVDGKVSYAEGIHIGYRAWLRAGTEPAYPFGHGLGYTTWQLDRLQVSPAEDGGAELEISVTNTGSRTGKQIVQVYLSRPDSRTERPVRWLAGFAPVRADPGQTIPIKIGLPARSFAHWEDAAWRLEPGDYDVHVGAAVGDLPLRATVKLTGDQ
jgi:beta-glucosidase